MWRAVVGLLAVLATTNATAVAKLEREVLAGDGWVVWRVPMVAGVEAPCCHSVRRGQPVQHGCALDRGEWSFGSERGHVRTDDTLSVYVHVADHRIDDVRAIAASCPVASRTPVRVLDGIDPAESLALLVAEAQARGGSRGDGPLLAAIGYHGLPDATTALVGLAAPWNARERRGQALFWLGRLRGVEGTQAVEHSARQDADPDLREKAIFALSQASAGDPYPTILGIARSDTNARVRGQALFWMAQMDDPRAARDITAALATETSPEAREQAVFALSQLDDGAEDALIGVLRGDFPRDAKKRALFWLGQSGSPKAIEALDAVLASPP